MWQQPWHFFTISGWQSLGWCDAASAPYTRIVDIVIPESQCGFRRGRSTIDMMFVARLLQEKCREQHQSLFFAFIDLTKAFDTVNRELLWKVLSKFGCPPHFLQILREFHDGMSARVTVGGHESDPFDVLVGVKQGCVLAPVIFNLFLVAVTLVFRNGLPPNAGIPINFRLDGNLFNIRRLQAKTKISSDTIFDLQYADDAAIPNHTAAGLQDTLDILAATYQRAGLIVNTKKTEVLPQSMNSATHPTFTIHGDPLNEVHQFTYLGSTLTSDCDLDNEVQQRIKLASVAFGRLSHRVFLNHNLATTTKVAVYKAICISILLYGCETWTPYRRHIKALEAFHMRCLKSILGIRWWHKVTHVETRHRAADIDTAEYMLLQRQLRWIGHVIRMPSNRLPRRLLYGELLNGKRMPGGPKLRYVDHIRRLMNKSNIPISDLEKLAADRDTWRSACASGLSTLCQVSDQAAADRRSRRHHRRSPTATGPRCPQCSRVCASEFGLRSHLRSHISRPLQRS